MRTMTELFVQNLHYETLTPYPDFGGNLGGKKFYVNAALGSDGNDGQDPTKPVKSLTTGYARLRSGYNDILCIQPSATALSLSTAFTWAKPFTHLIGLGPVMNNNHRNRINQSANFSPLFTVSTAALGCEFFNFYIQGGRGSATNVNTLLLQGSRNRFGFVHVAAGLNATEAAEAGLVDVFIDGGSENLFVGGTLGENTIPRTKASCVLKFDSMATRNRFVGTHFRCAVGATSSNNPVMIRVADANGCDRETWMDGCEFEAWSENYAMAMASAFDIPANMPSMRFILKNPVASGITKFDSNTRGNVLISGPVPTGATSGLAVAVA